MTSVARRPAYWQRSSGRRRATRRSAWRAWWSTGLEAAALIDRHIDKYGSRLHPLHQFLGHQLWCRGAFDQDCADHKIGSKDLGLERVIGRVDRLKFSPETTGKPVEHVEIAVENGDL